VRLARLERGECDLEMDDRRDLDGIFASLHGGIWRRSPTAPWRSRC
jgi:hypothetical protein